MKGNPCWDSDELWTTMGHLYKGGMWFKKKSKISNFTDAHVPDNPGIDRRKQFQSFTNSSLKPGPLSANEIDDYFYLPALGDYFSGELRGVGEYGAYWSSSADPWNTANGLYLRFNNSRASEFQEYRYYGIWAQKFTDFGDN